jgi:hypothetical protein
MQFSGSAEVWLHRVGSTGEGRAMIAAGAPAFTRGSRADSLVG